MSTDTDPAEAKRKNAVPHADRAADALNVDAQLAARADLSSTSSMSESGIGSRNSKLKETRFLGIPVHRTKSIEEETKIKNSQQKTENLRLMLYLKVGVYALLGIGAIIGILKYIQKDSGVTTLPAPRSIAEASPQTDKNGSGSRGGDRNAATGFATFMPQIKSLVHNTHFNVYPRYAVLEWYAMPSAVKYEVTVEAQDGSSLGWPDPGNDQPVMVEDTSYGFSASGKGAYRWCIRGIDKDGIKSLASYWQVFYSDR